MKKILLLLLVILAAFLGYAAIQPDEYKVSRSITIPVPAERVFPLVASNKKWMDWSPWSKKDPNAKWTFEGPDADVGGITRWEGNMEVGTGSSKIVEVRPNQYIRYDLSFEKPMKGAATSDLTFEQKGADTSVTWTMAGNKNFVAKVMGVIFNCEKMIGEEFDKGLADLKKLAETSAAAAPVPAAPILVPEAGVAPTDGTVPAVAPLEGAPADANAPAAPVVPEAVPAAPAEAAPAPAAAPVAPEAAAPSAPVAPEAAPQQ